MDRKERQKRIDNNEYILEDDHDIQVFLQIAAEKQLERLDNWIEKHRRHTKHKN